MKNKIAYAVIFLFLLAKLLTIFNYNVYNVVWWDSAVYIGMGKYIYSFGKAGLWEPSRPLILPLMLGFLWKTGLNPILFGRIAEIIFGSLCILLTYLIGKRLFSKKTAILASIFLAVSPTFFFFNGIMLTEVISTFFALAAIYFFIDKRYFISGIFFGIAFMARFLQLFAFISITLASLFYFYKRRSKALRQGKDLAKIAIGFFVIIFPYLILNQVMYNNFLYPFLQQIYLSNNSGWLNYHQLNYYFILLFKENFAYLLAFAGAVAVLLGKKGEKGNKDARGKLAVGLAFLLFFSFFNSIKQKEMRFLIVLLPYMYLLASFSLMNFFDSFKNKPAKVLFFAVVIAAIIFASNTIYAYYKNEGGKKNQYAALQDKLMQINSQANSNAKIWVSSPVISVSSNRKIDKLVYYPVFNEEKKEELIKDLGNADFIFVDSCDLACKPDDLKCSNAKKELMEFFRQRLKTVYYSNGACGQLVLEK